MGPLITGSDLFTVYEKKYVYGTQKSDAQLLIYEYFWICKQGSHSIAVSVNLAYVMPVVFDCHYVICVSGF